MLKKQITLTMLFIATGCTTYRPGSATSNSLSTTDRKMGTACRSWILHPELPFGWGRNDIMTAATEAKIEKVAVVDGESTSYLLYGKQCTVVYGH